MVAELVVAVLVVAVLVVAVLVVAVLEGQARSLMVDDDGDQAEHT